MIAPTVVLPVNGSYSGGWNMKVSPTMSFAQLDLFPILSNVAFTFVQSYK